MTKIATDPLIRFTDIGGVSELLCPRCSSRHLHQVSVVLYDRAEDAASLLKVEVGGSRVTTSLAPSIGSGNPSNRRHGLVIRFLCEGCRGGEGEDTLELTLAQHKGATEVVWRFTPRP